MTAAFSRVAVVHDWLTGMRGGEKILEAILELFPSADLFTLFHLPGTVSPQIERHRIITSPLQKWAGSVGDYRRLLPFYPSAIRGWDFSGYDLIISSSHCVAKGVRGNAPHVSYCHTPMRYIWDRFDDYFPWRQPLKRLAGTAVAIPLRGWDVRTAAHVDQFIANSSFVRERIRRYYDRDAEVIHPFVSESFLDAPLQQNRGDYHLIVSALVPYKKLEIALDAARESGVRLVVIGDGPERRRLEKRAGRAVEFLGAVSEPELIEKLSAAQSLILPGVEDFGITPLEAMACGTPVIAFRGGGALETVVEGVTGLFFDSQDSASLAVKIREVSTRQWRRETLRAHAAGFSRMRFQARFQEFLTRLSFLNPEAGLVSEA